MSKQKQKLNKEFLKRGYNVDWNKKNGQYIVYKLGCVDGYFNSLESAKDYICCIDLCL